MSWRSHTPQELELIALRDVCAGMSAHIQEARWLLEHCGWAYEGTIAEEDEWQRRYATWIAFVPASGEPPTS